MSSILSALRAEEASLRAELEGVPVYRRLVKLRALIREYEPETAVHPKHRVSVDGLAAAQNRSRATTSSEVIRVSRDYLEHIGRRAQTPELVAELERRGVVVNHPKKIAIVSSYLSNSPLFDNKRNEGYGLVSWTSNDEQQVEEIPAQAHQEIGAAAQPIKEEAAAPVEPSSSSVKPVREVEHENMLT